MINKHKVHRIIMCILGLCLLLLGIACGSDNNSFDSYIEEYKEDSLFIATRGIYPNITTDSERLQWENLVSKCWLNITKMGPSYSEIDESIVSYSHSERGIVIVNLDTDYKDEITKSRIDKIYQNISNYCQQDNINNMPIVFMWLNTSEYLPIPDYDPERLDEAKNGSWFIAARGTMPVINHSAEKREWEELLVQCTRNNEEILQYFASAGGPVISFGFNINGYLKVGLESDTPEKVNESIIDEIYHVINEQCEKEGIDEVPVVFEWEHIVVDEELDDEPVSPNLDENTEMIDNGSEESGIESKKETPAFTSLMVFVCLFFLVIIKRK